MGLKIRLAIYVAIAAAVAAIIGYQHWQIGRMQASMRILAGNNAKLETAVERQKETVGALEVGLGEAIANGNALAERLAVVDKQRQVKVQELNAYRGRLGNAALEKPALVERRATGNTADVLRDFAAETRSR